MFNLGQNSKTIETLILPAVVANNQPVPWPIGGSNNQKFSLNNIGIGFRIYQLFSEWFP